MDIGPNDLVAVSSVHFSLSVLHCQLCVGFGK